MATPSLKQQLILGAIAWFLGFVAYLAALRLIWQQGISVFDFIGVAQLSLSGFAPAYVLVYLPAFSWLSRHAPVRHHFWLFPGISLPLGFIPTTLIWLAFGIPQALGGSGLSASLPLRYFVSPETSLFYWFFGVAGVVAAVGFVQLHRRETAI
jgi:hypothetical protein